jgi:IS605 OrfB family transposase
MSGRERRFVACVNHRISRELVDGPHATFVLEDLVGIGKSREMTTEMRTKLATWPYYRFERFLKYKAEEVGKTVVKVSSYLTSRRCSRCGHVAINNRDGPDFNCRRCGYRLNADLNAARNIALAGKSGKGRLCVNQPYASRNESPTFAKDSGSDERRCEFLQIAHKGVVDTDSSVRPVEEQLTLYGVGSGPRCHNRLDTVRRPE